MIWTVLLPARVKKQADRLPLDMQKALFALLAEIRAAGPVLPLRPHYGRLKGQGKREVHHCHINKGRPTYVAVWEVVDKKVRIVEVRYAGTHENAPY